MNLFNMTAYATEAAATTATPTTASGDGLSMIIMIVAMVAIFYFMLIRPQRKKDKAVKDMLSSLKTGDRICTIGGFYGTVRAVKDDTITLSFGSMENTVVISRWAVRSIENVNTENEAQPEV